ncbi:MAG: PIN domain-containing protein [Thermoplasmata archaeon]
MILDTCFIIDLIEGDEGAVQKAEELEKSNQSMTLSSATVFELFTGVTRCDKPEEEKEKILEVIESKRVVEADKNIMKKSGKLHGDLIEKGDRISAFDCMIGTTAVIEGEPILTRNKKEFDRIHGITVKQY